MGTSYARIGILQINSLLLTFQRSYIVFTACDWYKMLLCMEVKRFIWVAERVRWRNKFERKRECLIGILFSLKNYNRNSPAVSSSRCTLYKDFASTSWQTFCGNIALDYRVCVWAKSRALSRGELLCLCQPPPKTERRMPNEICTCFCLTRAAPEIMNSPDAVA